MLRLIALDTTWYGKLLAPLRRRRALTYYEAVRDFGGPSFWYGKNSTYSTMLDISTNRPA